jgi:hypothetical protein
MNSRRTTLISCYNSSLNFSGLASPVLCESAPGILRLRYSGPGWAELGCVLRDCRKRRLPSVLIQYNTVLTGRSQLRLRVHRQLRLEPTKKKKKKKKPYLVPCCTLR